MRKFLASLLFSLAFILGCVPATPIHYTQHQYSSTYLHKTVYLDHSLTLFQEVAVLDALHEWECATDHRVSFEIKLYAVEADYNLITSTATSLVIRNVVSSNPAIIQSDLVLSKRKQYTLGLYNASAYIPEILMVDNRIKPSEYGIVALHELGHSLLISHVKEHNSIMHAGVDQDIAHLTKNDLIAFCNLYWCDPNELHVCR